MYVWFASGLGIWSSRVSGAVFPFIKHCDCVKKLSARIIKREHTTRWYKWRCNWNQWWWLLVNSDLIGWVTEFCICHLLLNAMRLYEYRRHEQLGKWHLKNLRLMRLIFGQKYVIFHNKSMVWTLLIVPWGRLIKYTFFSSVVPLPKNIIYHRRPFHPRRASLVGACFATAATSDATAAATAATFVETNPPLNQITSKKCMLISFK